MPKTVEKQPIPAQHEIIKRLQVFYLRNRLINILDLDKSDSHLIKVLMSDVFHTIVTDDINEPEKIRKLINDYIKDGITLLPGTEEDLERIILDVCDIGRGLCHGLSLSLSAMYAISMQDWWLALLDKISHWDGWHGEELVDLPGQTRARTLDELLNLALNYVLFLQADNQVCRYAR